MRISRVLLSFCLQSVGYKGNITSLMKIEIRDFILVFEKKINVATSSLLVENTH